MYIHTTLRSKWDGVRDWKSGSRRGKVNSDKIRAFSYVAYNVFQIVFNSVLANSTEVITGGTLWTIDAPATLADVSLQVYRWVVLAKAAFMTNH